MEFYHTIRVLLNWTPGFSGCAIQWYALVHYTVKSHTSKYCRCSNSIFGQNDHQHVDDMLRCNSFWHEISMFWTKSNWSSVIIALNVQLISNAYLVLARRRINRLVFTSSHNYQNVQPCGVIRSVNRTNRTHWLYRDTCTSVVLVHYFFVVWTKRHFLCPSFSWQGIARSQLFNVISVCLWMFSSYHEWVREPILL